MVSLTGDIVTGQKILQAAAKPSSAPTWNSAARRR
jgi:hypothetical protein